MPQNLQKEGAIPPFPEQEPQPPGLESKMQPRPGYGENSYVGNARLKGESAVITGNDSGIGRAIAPIP